MTTPEADPADLAEQHASATRDEARTPDVEVPLEAPAADVAEQQIPAAPGEHDAARDVPLGADDLDGAGRGAVGEQEGGPRRAGGARWNRGGRQGGGARDGRRGRTRPPPAAPPPP